MTIGTDSRNLPILVKAIMQNNQVDNFKLELDLVGAFTRYVNAREEGKSPAEIRTRILEEFGALGFFGISDTVRERAKMKQTIEDTLRLNINDDSPAWEEVLDFCIKAEKKGETVKAYQSWREKDVFNSPKAHQISQSPKMIIGTWPQAFSKTTPSGRKFERLNG